MARIILFELLKTFSKWRTYIGFIAIGVIVPLVMVALKLEGGSLIQNLTMGLQRDFFLLGNLFNGYFVTMVIMNSLWVHIPFLIALVAGDQIAGEGTAGTFRLLLIRPTSRSRILFAKFVTTWIYTLLLIVSLALLSIGFGVALFGTGDLLVPGETLLIITHDDVLWRLLLAFGLAALSMWCVASLGLLFSSCVENAIGPIVGTMAVIIVFIVVSNIPLEFFREVRPYLFTTYFTVWQKALQEPIVWDTIAEHVGVLLAYSTGFCLATWYIFVRRDILS